MTLIADALLAGGALLSALYCLILSRRLRKFTDLEKGVGGAVALLAAKADDLHRTLRAAQTSAKTSVTTLEDVSERAEAAARHLELLVASLHSLPDQKAMPRAKPDNPFQAKRAAGMKEEHA